jgi:ATP-dependent protease ClpP protease subunit
MSKWYDIKAKATPQAADQKTSAEVFIYGDIGESWWGDSVAASDFVKEIAALDVEELTVRINSYGGSVSDGLAIYNALKRHKATVTVSIDGVAVSIASLIAMAGDTVEMAENAMFMVHAPWGYASGNSALMREYADLLDKYAQAMSNSYAAKTGKSAEDCLALLTDGADHWFTAAEAQAEGYVDTVTTALAVAASFDREAFAARAKNPPAAKAAGTPVAAATPPQEHTMPQTNPAAQQAQAAPQPNQAEIHAAGVRAEADRRASIQASFKPFASQDGVADLQTACEGDLECTADDAKAKLLAHLGKSATPAASNHVVTVQDETDNLRAAAVNAIVARSGLMQDASKRRAAMQGNPFVGMKLLDMAKASLERAGVSCAGMDQRKIVATAFTQGTSDFPILLENTMHRVLQDGYTNAADTWKRFCKIGSVSDFRAHNRYRTGSIGNLDTLNELGEFKNKTIPDGEKAQVQADTKGNIINISRQTIINDDLGAFVGLADTLGRAAARTIETDVYALLALNGGLGPIMSDGKTLFHADHGNIGTAALLSMASLDADRVLMGSQKDISGNDFLDLSPAVLLVSLALGGTARGVIGAEYDPDTSGKLQKPNIVKDLVRDVVDTARLSGTRRYLFADPVVAPTLEVSFLDGMEEPYLETEEGFTVDGARWKVRLDFGVDAVDYRGAVTNAGTA